VDDLIEKLVDVMREFKLELTVVRTGKYAPPGSELRGQWDQWYFDKEAKKTGRKRTSEGGGAEADPFEDMEEVRRLSSVVSYHHFITPIRTL
jgi:hypothetical protein